MKKVDRKFLEEQVKLMLKEQSGVAASGGHPINLKYSKEVEQALRATPEIIWDFIVSIPFGSPSSYVDLIKWLDDGGMYGFGTQRYIKKVRDYFGGNFNAFDYLMLRFAENAPIEMDAELTFLNSMNVVFREDLAQELVSSRDWTVEKLSNVTGNDTKKIKSIEKILVDLASGGTARWPMKSIKSLEDIAEEYNFSAGYLDHISNTWPWEEANQIEIPTVFKDPDALEKSGIYKDYAKDDFLKITKDKKSLIQEVEKFMMFHFYGLEQANFQQAYNRMRLESNIQQVARATLALQAWSRMGRDAIIGAVDITLSVGSTAAAVLCLLSGVAAPAAPIAPLTKNLYIKALKEVTETAFSKRALQAKELLEAPVVGNAIKRVGNFWPQFTGYFAAGLPDIIESSYDWLIGDLVELNTEFQADYQNKTEEERVAFYEEFIKPKLGRIVVEQASAYREILGIPDGMNFGKTLSTQLVNPEHLEEMYREYDIQRIIESQQKISAATEKLKSAYMAVQNEEMSTVNKMAKEMAEGVEKAEKAATDAETGGNIKLPKAFGEPIVQKPKTQKSPETAAPEQEMKQRSFGSDEKTSDEVYEEVRKALEGLNEQTKKNVEIFNINIGYKDAIEYAKGTEGYSIEKTKQVIEKTAELVKKHGKIPNITALPKLTKADSGVDVSKFNEFAKDINSFVKDKKYSKMLSPVVQKDKVQVPQRILVAGDSVAVGMAKHGGAVILPGSNSQGGIHTVQILARLKKVKASKTGETVYISAGVNDALAHSMTSGKAGATPNGLPRRFNDGPWWTPELTIRDIDNIYNILTAKGYQVSFRELGPVPWSGKYASVDGDRFNNFCNKVNSHISRKGYAHFPTAVPTSDGIHPTLKGYERLVNQLKLTGNINTSISSYAKKMGIIKTQNPEITQKQITIGDVKSEMEAGRILFAGDSIVVGMATGSGTGIKSAMHRSPKYKGKRDQRRIENNYETAKWGVSSKWTHEQLVKYFSENPGEATKQGDKIIIISAGTNDAIKYAKGYSNDIKNTLKNIKDIAELAIKNGYTPRIMPLLAYTGGDTYDKVPFYKENWDEFRNEFNNDPLVKKYGFDSTLTKAEMASDGIHAKVSNGYRKLLTNALSGVSVTISTPVTGAAPVSDYNPYQAPQSWGYRIFNKRIEKNNVWEIVQKYSRKYNFDPLLHMGLLRVESGYRQNAIGYLYIYKKDPKNPKKFLLDKDGKKILDKKIAAGKGIAQFIDSTAKKYGVNQFDVESSIDGSIRLLLDLKKLTEDAFRRNKNLDYDKLSEAQKYRLMLYGYHGGVWSSIRNSKTNEEVFRRREAYYEKKQGAKYRENGWKSGDYSLVIFEAAEKIGFKPDGVVGSTIPTAAVGSAAAGTASAGTGATQASPSATTGLSIAPAAASAAAAGTSSAQAKKAASKNIVKRENIQPLIIEMKTVKNYNDFIPAFGKLFKMDIVTVEMNQRDLDEAKRILLRDDLGDYTSRKIRLLKSIHRMKSSSWSAIYNRDIRAAGNDPKQIAAADRKMAFLHRPIFYSANYTKNVARFFGSRKITFGFEPNSSRVATSFEGKMVFYNNNFGNKYNLFLSDLKNLSEAVTATNDIIDQLKVTEKNIRIQEKLEIYEKYMETLNDVLSGVYSTLSDLGSAAARKANAVSSLTLAFQAMS